jgi:hypothetical protein
MKLSTFLELKGSSLIVLPPKNKLPNPNQQIDFYLRLRLFPKISLNVNDKDF